MSTEPTERPALRIVRGEPTAEELAVLTALVTAASGGGADEPEPARRGRWADPVWQHVAMRRPGPGAWAASYR
jgi:Acyl-CoA carboxylase epsilon subunit